MTRGEPLLRGLVQDVDRRSTWLAASGAFAVASLLIFVLPLHVPVPYRPTVSASYVAGFNNGVAIVAAGSISVFVFLLTLWSQRRSVAAPRPDTSGAWSSAREEQLSARFITITMGISALVLSLCGGLVELSHLNYLGDSGYFIEQATVRQDTGRALYTQLEFAYGPLLLLPEVWLSRLLRCTMTTAYFITLVIGESLGLLLLAYVLNELPMRRSPRRVALVLFAFGAITPLLGLNYTFLRFATPMAVLLFATRSRSPWRCAVLLTAGEVLVLLLSPELGLALTVGIVAFALPRAVQQGSSWLFTAALPLLALATLLFTLGRPYLVMIATFSGGTLNLPVAPYPDLLVLVFALAWVVPVGLGRSMNLREPQSARLLGVYALSLAFLPAALGRCDPLHVFFNGTGVLLLSLAAVSRSTHRVRTAWLACIVVLVLWEHVVNDRFYEYRTATVLGLTVMPHLPAKLQVAIVQALVRKKPDFAKKLQASKAPEYQLETAALQSLVGSELIATPLEVSPAVREALRLTHHARPGYYGYWVDVLNLASEQRSIAELNAASWALLPDQWDGPPLETPAKLRDVQGFVFHYPQRHRVPYDLGSAFRKNVLANWTPVRRFDHNILYRNTGAGHEDAHDLPR